MLADFNFWRFVAKAIIMTATALFLLRAVVFCKRAWQFDLKWRWRHHVCQKKGHIPIPGWQQRRSKYMLGYICQRCGDWLQDVKKVGPQTYWNLLYGAARRRSGGNDGQT